MLSSIRKFSSSIYAKIFLFIVAIPFVFWGMGDVFRGGNQNTIVKIDKKNIPTSEFINFIKYNANTNNINDNFIKEILYTFIGEKLIDQEINSLNIKISDKSLSKIIKNEKTFKRNNQFSRIEYEKFLLKNNMNAVNFERNFSKQAKKDMLFKFIGSGTVSPYFLVDMSYNKIKQIRNVEYININEVLKKKSKFTEKDIKNYYNKNKELFIETYKTINFINLNPKNLSEGDDYDNLFFSKIDEIDDLIVEGKKFEFIINKFDLNKYKSFTVNENGTDKDSKKIEDNEKELIKKIFKTETKEGMLELIEDKEKFYIFEIKKIDSMQKTIDNESVQNEILLNLEMAEKRKMVSKIISNINNNSFKKKDFYNFSKKNKVNINKAKINGLKDDSIFDKDVVEQIYDYSKNKVIIVSDMNLVESYLIYIDKIQAKTIDKNSEEYKKYLSLTKANLTRDLFRTYDDFLNKKYKIDINYKALSGVNNYF